MTGPDTAPPRDLVAAALAAPSACAGWTAGDWSRLMRQARGAGLLARVMLVLRQAWPPGSPTPPPWPAAFETHAEAAACLSAAQQREIDRELQHIQQALADLDAPVVLLKGAAYVAAGLPPAAGRIFADVDILVPRRALDRAETQLMVNGWMTTHHSAYDQRYYRQWMHELPPLQHLQRGTTLDVHHTIVPDTSRFKPPAGRLFDDLVPLPGRPGLYVLAPADMVLHSITHLFINDDLSHGLRDLSDIDLLLRHFGADPAFWPRLVARGRELDLARLLYWALRHAARVLKTPVPAAALQAAEAAAPAPPLRWLMDAIWTRALAPPHPSAALPGRPAALFALYLRGHWLRMPPLLLARHLSIKALRLHERGTAPAAGPG